MDGAKRDLLAARQRAEVPRARRDDIGPVDEIPLPVVALDKPKSPLETLDRAGTERRGRGPRFHVHQHHLPAEPTRSNRSAPHAPAPTSALRWPRASWQTKMVFASAPRASSSATHRSAGVDGGGT